MDRWLELPKLPGTLGRCPLACLRGPPSPRDTTRLDVRWASLMALDRSMLRSLSTPAPDAGLADDTFAALRVLWALDTAPRVRPGRLVARGVLRRSRRE